MEILEEGMTDSRACNKYVPPHCVTVYLILPPYLIVSPY